jgi:hypothetical protein
MLKFFDADPDPGRKISDPGSGMENVGYGIRDKHNTTLYFVLYLYLIQEALLASCGPWGKVGFSKAMSAGWIQIDKSGTVPGTGYRHPSFQ